MAAWGRFHETVLAKSLRINLTICKMLTFQIYYFVAVLKSMKPRTVSITVQKNFICNFLDEILSLVTR
jgi:hypothetical protein